MSEGLSMIAMTFIFCRHLGQIMASHSYIFFSNAAHWAREGRSGKVSAGVSVGLAVSPGRAALRAAPRDLLEQKPQYLFLAHCLEVYHRAQGSAC